MKFHPVGLLVAAGACAVLAGGVYVVAASTASSIAETFITTESDLSARRADWQSAMTRASAKYALARGRCDELKGKRRDRCNADARKDERRTVLLDGPVRHDAP